MTRPPPQKTPQKRIDRQPHTTARGRTSATNTALAVLTATPAPLLTALARDLPRLVPPGVPENPVSRSARYGAPSAQLRSTDVHVRRNMIDGLVSLDQVQGIDRWKPRNKAVTLLTALIASIGTEAFLQAIDPNADHLTGSSSGDYAVAAGLGVVGGVIINLVWPGRWHRYDYVPEQNPGPRDRCALIAGAWRPAGCPPPY